MRKLAVVLILLLAISITGCLAGPHQLTRTVDDWDHKNYVESPWMNGILNGFAVVPLAKMIAGFGDMLTGDLYAFWFRDAWSGKGGAGFNHAEVTHTDGAMSSMISDGKWMDIK